MGKNGLSTWPPLNTVSYYPRLFFPFKPRKDSLLWNCFKHFFFHFSAYFIVSEMHHYSLDKFCQGGFFFYFFSLPLNRVGIFLSPSQGKVFFLKISKNFPMEPRVDFFFTPWRRWFFFSSSWRGWIFFFFLKTSYPTWKSNGASLKR